MKKRTVKYYVSYAFTKHEGSVENWTFLTSSYVIGNAILLYHKKTIKEKDIPNIVKEVQESITGDYIIDNFVLLSWQKIKGGK